MDNATLLTPPSTGLSGIPFSQEMNELYNPKGLLLVKINSYFILIHLYVLKCTKVLYLDPVFIIFSVNQIQMNQPEIVPSNTTWDGRSEVQDELTTASLVWVLLSVKQLEKSVHMVFVCLTVELANSALIEDRRYQLIPAAKTGQVVPKEWSLMLESA